jgi:magnesium-transporting ATPase (P-type)
MLPQHKEIVVRTLQAQAGCVAFVGDGFNDVAALRRADVAIAFSAAHAVVRDSADVVLVVDDLSALSALSAAGQHVHATLTLIGNNVLWRVIVCAVVWVGTVCTQTPSWSPLDSTAIALIGVALPNLLYMFVTHHGSVQQSGRASILRAVGVGALFVGGWWCATTLWGVSDVRWLTATVIVALWVRVWFTRKTW